MFIFSCKELKTSFFYHFLAEKSIVNSWINSAFSVKTHLFFGYLVKLHQKYQFTF